MRTACGSLVIGIVLMMSVSAYAQGRTDVVTLANGDQITGEVKRLERGRLEFKTDDAGTLYLEWDKLVSVVAAARQVEVLTTDGRRFIGTLAPAASRELAVRIGDATTSVPMADVTLIDQIGISAWSKLGGSIDFGFSYTKSSGIAQLNLNTLTTYRKPASSVELSGSLTQTYQHPDSTSDESSEDDRGSVSLSYLRFPWLRWFVSGVASFESNQSLGLDLRSQVGGAVGPRLINSNRGQLNVGGGVVVNDERGVDVEPTQNVDALFAVKGSYYTYDRPKTNLDLKVAYYPSLSNWGRNPMQLDAAMKREIFKDFFVSVSGFDTFDSRPPNPASDRNDVGVVFSIGWTY
jgi:hypothetical protein